MSPFQPLGFLKQAFRPTLPENRWKKFLMKSGYWILPLLFGLLVAGLTYGLLPDVGVSSFAYLFSLKKLFILLLFTFLVPGYFIYFKWIQKNPHYLVLFVLCLWALINYANLSLMESGINVRQRPLLLLLIGLPGLWITLSAIKHLWTRVPHFKYMFLFFGWICLYFLFYNSHAQEISLVISDSLFSGADLSILMIFSYFYGFMTIGMTALSVWKTPHPQKYFDTLNKLLLLSSGAVALYTIIGYPFLLTSTWLDGFQRAMGVFTHPNPYAHHMGVLMVYLLGIYLYYQGPQSKRMPKTLLAASLILNLIAFLLGLSKTAIGVFVIASTILFFLNLSSPIVRKNMWKVLLSLIFILPLGIVLYSMITGQGFIELIEARMGATNSMDWRSEIWGFLLANIHGGWILIGHGFTDANVWVHHLSYNSETNAVPLLMVHNGYIALMYDFGLLGWLYFIAVFSNMRYAFRIMKQASEAHVRTLASLILCLSVYFLIVCAFDEMAYMFDAPLLFWVFTTLLTCLIQVETKITPQAAGLAAQAVSFKASSPARASRPDKPDPDKQDKEDA